jgi:hypothetical protein
VREETQAVRVIAERKLDFIPAFRQFLPDRRILAPSQIALLVAPWFKHSSFLLAD